jgi:hypothetical protein
MRLAVAKVFGCSECGGSSLKSANWGPVVVLSNELSALRWGVWVDCESELVDGDMMMEPADQRKVGWIVVTAL